MTTKKRTATKHPPKPTDDTPIRGPHRQPWTRRLLREALNRSAYRDSKVVAMILGRWHLWIARQLNGEVYLARFYLTTYGGDTWLEGPATSGVYHMRVHGRDGDLVSLDLREFGHKSPGWGADKVLNAKNAASCGEPEVIEPIVKYHAKPRQRRWLEPLKYEVTHLHQRVATVRALCRTKNNCGLTDNTYLVKHSLSGRWHNCGCIEWADPDDREAEIREQAGQPPASWHERRRQTQAGDARRNPKYGTNDWPIALADDLQRSRQTAGDRSEAPTQALTRMLHGMADSPGMAEYERQRLTDAAEIISHAKVDRKPKDADAEQA